MSTTINASSPQAQAVAGAVEGDTISTMHRSYVDDSEVAPAFDDHEFPTAAGAREDGEAPCKLVFNGMLELHLTFDVNDPISGWRLESLTPVDREQFLEEYLDNQLLDDIELTSGAHFEARNFMENASALAKLGEQCAEDIGRMMLEMMVLQRRMAWGAPSTDFGSYVHVWADCTKVLHMADYRGSTTWESIPFDAYKGIKSYFRTFPERFPALPPLIPHDLEVLVPQELAITLATIEEVLIHIRGGTT